jgi:hypothetical protein
MGRTASVYLPSSRKFVFMQHRWFLERKRKYHKMKRHFDNTVEKDSALKQYTRKLLFEMVKNIEVVFGKGTVKRQKRKKTPTSTHIPFKKQSIFPKYLTYWKDLETCHIIDLMHVTNNVFGNIIGTLLDMLKKMKDRLKACSDLVQFDLRPELHPKLRANGKHYLTPASYSLTVEEKKHSVNACVGASAHRFLIQHQQTSLSERLIHVWLQFSQLSCDDDGFSHNRNKGHQIHAYQSTHHTLVLLFQYSLTEGDWSYRVRRSKSIHD